MYVVIIVDRHTDPDVKLFVSRDDAIAEARAYASDCADDPDRLDESLTENMIEVGWLYHASWSEESDYVYVVARSVSG